MKIVNSLQDRFDSFINENGVNFRKGLQVYVEWANSQPLLYQSINCLKEEEKKFYSQAVKLNDKALLELDKSLKRLLSAIKKIKVQIPSLTNILEDIDYYEHGKLSISTHGFPFEKSAKFINDKLLDICRLLRNNSLGYSIDAFENKNNKIETDYVFSNTYLELGEETNRLYSNRIDRIWYMWEDIRISLLIFGSYKEEDLPEVTSKLRYQIKQVHQYFKENLNMEEKTSPLDANLYIAKARKDDFVIFSNDDINITFNGVAFFVNGLYVGRVNKGGVPIKIWNYGYENRILCIPWEEIEKLGMTQEKLRDSIDKTHRRSLFNMIEKHCKDTNIDLPSSFFENLLRNIPGGGFSLFSTKVR